MCSGTPWAPGMSPPYSLHLATNSGRTEEAPCKTIGKLGRRSPTFLRRSKSRYGSPLNLYAPWEVPIAIAKESTPVSSTNSAACSGSVKRASLSDTLTSSSTPAKRPNSASTTTPCAWAYSTTCLVILTFSSKSWWEASIITEVKPPSTQSLQISKESPWSR